MLDQITYDRSEEIADALHEQAGLERALIGVLGNALSPEQEMTVFALIAAQAQCRNRAMHIADCIARSGKEPDG